MQPGDQARLVDVELSCLSAIFKAPPVIAEGNIIGMRGEDASHNVPRIPPVKSLQPPFYIKIEFPGSIFRNIITGICMSYYPNARVISQDTT
jgi:hypothetical protein